jgi:acetylornithine deacetylase/succinyl-diaminopimelate desuccinylase-like protein
MGRTMESAKTRSFVDHTWEESIVPALMDYVTIPALSPMFDREWERNGHIEKAMRLIESWCRKAGVKGLSTEIVRLPGRSPLLYMEVPGTAPGTVLLYGHMDKQPAMIGWREGLGPWTPVVEDGKLYGRGGADDGYAVFASVTAIKALQEQGAPHARCVVLIEATEESGSPDLPPYVDHLAERIGQVELIICLDSGAGDYDRLWLTASLRGIVVGNLRVEVLKEAVHSGTAGGIVPDSFRIARALLGRLEDEKTGEIRIPGFQVEIPPDRRKQAREVARVLGSRIHEDMGMVPGMRPMTDDPAELVLNNSWRPSLSVVGAEGFPPLDEGGNVIRTETAFKLSLRIPPGVDSKRAAETVKRTLESDPPYGARVSFEIEGPGDGWAAPPLTPWLEKSIAEASETYFGQPACVMGEGGSIPFMGFLGARFPKAQFVITGLLGPASNAHGPNEFLHIETGKRLTSCMAHVLAEQARAANGAG